MKKPSNKYRNNNGNGHNHSNQIYSLNYKFDSNSIAGKFSGTALDLIKKYNELARDAHNNNDIVNAEIFRQYAEHYRKIVTDINDKKMIRANSFKKDEEAAVVEQENTDSNSIEIENNSKEAEVNTSSDLKQAENSETEAKKTDDIVAKTDTKKKVVAQKKEFKVVEIKEKAKKVSPDKKIIKTTRTSRKNAEETVAAI